MRAGRALAAACIGLASVASSHAGDAARGEQIYSRCLACHALAYDRVGPRHCGLIGRRSGSVPDFDYSPAMKKAAIVWNEQTLDRFLAAPLQVVPGTKMTYAGVADAKERGDLIAFLVRANRNPACAK
jgi:cytochrome c